MRRHAKGKYIWVNKEACSSPYIVCASLNDTVVDNDATFWVSVTSTLLILHKKFIEVILPLLFLSCSFPLHPHAASCSWQKPPGRCRQPLGGIEAENCLQPYDFIVLWNQDGTKGWLDLNPREMHAPGRRKQSHWRNEETAVLRRVWRINNQSNGGQSPRVIPLQAQMELKSWQEIAANFIALLLRPAHCRKRLVTRPLLKIGRNWGGCPLPCFLESKRST